MRREGDLDDLIRDALLEHSAEWRPDVERAHAAVLRRLEAEDGDKASRRRFRRWATPSHQKVSGAAAAVAAAMLAFAVVPQVAGGVDILEPPPAAAPPPPPPPPSDAPAGGQDPPRASPSPSSAPLSTTSPRPQSPAVVAESRKVAPGSGGIAPESAAPIPRSSPPPVLRPGSEAARGPGAPPRTPEQGTTPAPPTATIGPDTAPSSPTPRPPSPAPTAPPPPPEAPGYALRAFCEIAEAIFADGSKLYRWEPCHSDQPTFRTLEEPWGPFDDELVQYSRMQDGVRQYVLGGEALSRESYLQEAGWTRGVVLGYVSGSPVTGAVEYDEWFQDERSSGGPVSWRILQSGVDPGPGGYTRTRRGEFYVPSDP